MTETKSRDQREKDYEQQLADARKDREEALGEHDKRFAKAPEDWSDEDKERQEYTRPTWEDRDGRSQDEKDWESKKAGREAEEENAAQAAAAAETAKKYRDEAAEELAASMPNHGEVREVREARREHSQTGTTAK